jgi:hypothetical protein
MAGGHKLIAEWTQKAQIPVSGFGGNIQDLDNFRDQDLVSEPAQDLFSKILPHAAPPGLNQKMVQKLARGADQILSSPLFAITSNLIVNIRHFYYFYDFGVHLCKRQILDRNQAIIA